MIEARMWRPGAHVGVGLASRMPAGILILCWAIVSRAQTFSNPVVGFDEQFYLLVGDRFLHGMLPYVDIFDRKPIGLFLIYAAARALGGDGFLGYKLVALTFVTATGFLLHHIAKHYVGRSAALMAALFYISWLNFMEGEGGQSPVFYNLLMVGAASLVLRASRQRDPLRCGAGAMPWSASRCKSSIVPCSKGCSSAAGWFFSRYDSSAAYSPFFYTPLSGLF
ncbi:hypothetical protein [Sphingomonas phyllosphaerae]|uniref:hypothetical protein n=1 Tax=Sphingomonas phyllosphaerae TaxID=257003 RepID=UPI002412FA5C|nr:hypothetical protein [Sphingomonas phyllosphaerae]